MDLAILETAAQVERALSLGLNLGSGVGALALEPEAIDALEREGRRHSTESELVSDARFQAVTQETLQRARTLATRLDEIGGVPLDRPVWGAVYLEIKRLLDVHLGHATVLADAVRTLAPQTVLAFRSDPGPPASDLGFGDSSPWCPAVEAGAAAAGVPLEWLPRPPSLGTSYASGGRRRWADRFETHPLWTAAAVTAGRRPQAAGHRARAGGPAVVIVTDTSEAVRDLAVAAADDGDRLLRWPGHGWPVVLAGPLWDVPRPTVRRSSRAAVRKWAAGAAQLFDRGDVRDAIRDAACRDGVDASTAVEGRLRAFAGRRLMSVALHPERARSGLERARARLVVGGTTAAWPARGVVRAAVELSVPVIGVQHGGGVGFLADEDVSLRVENDMLAEIDGYVAWGEGVVEEYCSKGPVPGVVREPRSLREIFERRGAARIPRSSPERAILFAPTNLAGNWRRGPGADLPDTAHYRLQQRVVEAVRTEPRTRLVVTLPTAEHAVNPLREWAATPPGCEIRHGGFRELMEGSDAIIVSWPFTALLEAIATDRPVLCIADDRTIHLRDSALALLRRRATVITDLSDVEHGIQAFVRELDEPALRDDQFLRRYGLGGTDAIDPLLAPLVTALAP